MSANLEELRKAHESAPLTAEAVPTFRDLFNQGWRAIIALELAKKRGKREEDSLWLTSRSRSSWPTCLGQ